MDFLQKYEIVLICVLPQILAAKNFLRFLSYENEG